MESVGLIFAAAGVFATMTIMPTEPQKLTVAGRNGKIIAECVMDVPTPPATVPPKPTPPSEEHAGDNLTFSTSPWTVEWAPPYHTVRDCKLLNGATLDEVMQAMCEALHGC